MALLQQPPNYSAQFEKFEPVKSMIASDRARQMGQESQLRQETQQANIDRFTEQSNLISVVEGAQKFLALPTGQTPEETAAIQTDFLQKRADEIKARGGDPRDTLETLAMAPEQRLEVANNVMKIGRDRGIITAQTSEFRKTPEERAAERDLRQQEIDARIKSATTRSMATAANREELKAYRQDRALVHKANTKKRSEERKTALAVKKQIAADKIEQKLVRGDANDMMKLAKLQEKNQGSLNTIRDLEVELGFELEDYDPTTNKIVGAPDEVDTAGVSVPFLGRVSFFSQKARTIQSRAAKLFNIVLKDRSGAAVTTPEMQRLKIEFGEGKFNTEPELLKAMALFKEFTINKMQQMEAGFEEKVINMYRDRGGITSADFAHKNETKPTPEGAQSSGRDLIYNPATGKVE